jgi:tetratricopeptide (TPR) repeat protein
MTRYIAAVAAVLLACSSGAAPGPQLPVDPIDVADAGVSIEEPIPQEEPPPPTTITDEILEREPPVSTNPSRTMARALKLYELADYHSAHLEFHKLLTEELPSAANRYRGEMFLAKTVARLGYHIPAYAMFSRIVQQGTAHPYMRPAATWLIWLVPKVWFAAGVVPLSLVDDPEMAPISDELRFRLAVSALTRSAVADAVLLVESIDPASPFHALASLELATTLWRVGKATAALEVLSRVTADGEQGARAAMVRGSALMREGKFDEAIASYEHAATYHSKYIDDAAFAVSAATLGRDGKLGALADDGVDWLIQISYYDYCLRGPSSDAFGQFRGLSDTVASELKAFVTKYEDPAELYDAVRKAMAGGTSMSDRARFFVNIVMNMDTPAEALEFAAELEAEMAIYLAQDEAWKSSAAAAEIHQEIALNMSLAQTDSGRIAAELIELMAQEIEGVALETEGIVIATLDEPGDGFTMLKRACPAN